VGSIFSCLQVATACTAEADDEKITIDKYTGTKRELIKSVIAGDISVYNTNMNCFGDDIVLLAKIENSEKGCECYMFFWFDNDSSDCCIGKFETVDNKEEIELSIINWLNECKEENKYRLVEKGYDNGIINYSKLPISFLRGWIKF
jgi:hypothetical protein